MKELKTEIVINASREKVWQALTDFAAYPAWNPFIVAISGRLAIGSTLHNEMLLKGKKYTFTPRITVLQEQRQFEWLGKMPLNLFTGNHYFLLESMGPQQTRLFHGERFSGWLSSLLLKKIGAATLQSFQQMNKALQQRAEALV